MTHTFRSVYLTEVISVANVLVELKEQPNVSWNCDRDAHFKINFSKLRQDVNTKKSRISVTFS